MNPAKRAQQERVARGKAEAMRLHPDATEVIISFFGGDMILDVWKDGEGGIARYHDEVDDIEAAYTTTTEALT